MKFLNVILLGCLVGGCSPKIYLVDRHTVLEEEAAGEWPDFEKDLLGGSSAQAPVPYRNVTLGEGQRRLLNILNGEVSSRTAAQNQAK